MRRLLVSHRTFVIVCLAVILTTTAGALLAVHEYERLLFDAFRERGIAYVQAFIASTTTWLDPVNQEMLHTASRLMLVGSSLYVQIALDGSVVIDERSSLFHEESMDMVDPPVSATAEVRSLAGRSDYLEVIVPIPALGAETSSGYGRIGIDRASVLLQVRHTALLAAGVTFLFNVLVLGSLFWSLQRHGAMAENSKDRIREAERLAAGTLAVDLDAKMVTLDGSPVALTPKQFALLSFLAENAGRVCSDREILDSVWTDSPYADAKDVKQYIYLVRRRLAKIDPKERNRIVTVPGFGYKLVSTPVDQGLTED